MPVIQGDGRSLANDPCGDCDDEDGRAKIIESYNSRGDDRGVYLECRRREKEGVYVITVAAQARSGRDRSANRWASG